MNGESSDSVRSRRPWAATPLACDSLLLLAQSWPFPWRQERMASYSAHRATTPVVIGRRLVEHGWLAAARSPRFRDLIGGEPGAPARVPRLIDLCRPQPQSTYA